MKLKRIFIFIFLNLFLFFNLFSNNSFGALNNNLQINSPSAILIEAKTGRILYEKEAYTRMYPASTTKIMTAILTLEHTNNLDDKTTISYNAIFSVPSGYADGLLKVGEEISIKELLYALLLKSSNEAANVLAEYVAGNVESFATIMNSKAIELGCQNTHFVNPNGVHNENHYTTAYDLSLIAKYAMQNDTFRQFVSTASHTLPSTNKYEKTDRNLITTNDLIKKSSKNYYDYAIGIKTGYTNQAKNCLVAGASKDGIELISVVLGAEKILPNINSVKDKDSITLFDYVYNNYSLKEIVKANSKINTVKISKADSKTKTLDLLAEKDISVLITNDKSNVDIKRDIILNNDLKAPISKSTVLGIVKYNIDGIEYSSNLIAANNVIEYNYWSLIFKILIIIIILFIIKKLLYKKNTKIYKKKRKGKYLKSFR